MTVRAFALVCLLGAAVVSSTAAVGAQQNGSAGSDAPAQAPQARDAGPGAPVNVDRLPLDIQRLERKLQSSAEREDWDGFRLRYTVEVFGTAPRLRFFEPSDVAPSGPIPYGAPTHKEMIEVMTPKEFRSPAMDFSSLMRWLQEKMK
jgi:hypothetical protein